MQNTRRIMHGIMRAAVIPIRFGIELAAALAFAIGVVALLMAAMGR